MTKKTTTSVTDAKKKIIREFLSSNKIVDRESETRSSRIAQFFMWASGKKETRGIFFECAALALVWSEMSPISDHDAISIRNILPSIKNRLHTIHKVSLISSRNSGYRACFDKEDEAARALPPVVRRQESVMLSMSKTLQNVGPVSALKPGTREYVEAVHSKLKALESGKYENIRQLQAAVILKAQKMSLCLPKLFGRRELNSWKFMFTNILQVEYLYA